MLTGRMCYKVQSRLPIFEFKIVFGIHRLEVNTTWGKLLLIVENMNKHYKDLIPVLKSGSEAIEQVHFQPK